MGEDKSERRMGEKGNWEHRNRKRNGGKHELLKKGNKWMRESRQEKTMR